MSDSCAYKSILWRLFLNWESLFPDDLRLCQVNKEKQPGHLHRDTHANHLADILKIINCNTGVQAGRQRSEVFPL